MLTVQKVKTFKGMEGMGGFNVELVFNGQPVAFVINEDCGGPLLWDWYEGKDRSGAVAALKEMPKYKETREKYPTLGEDEALDSALYEVLDQFEENKTVKRWCKTKIVWKTKDHKPQEYGIWKAPFTKENVAKILKKLPDAEIINLRFGQPT